MDRSLSWAHRCARPNRPGWVSLSGWVIFLILSTSELSAQFEVELADIIARDQQSRNARDSRLATESGSERGATRYPRPSLTGAWLAQQAVRGLSEWIESSTDPVPLAILLPRSELAGPKVDRAAVDRLLEEPLSLARLPYRGFEPLLLNALNQPERRLDGAGIEIGWVEDNDRFLVRSVRVMGKRVEEGEDVICVMTQGLASELAGPGVKVEGLPLTLRQVVERGARVEGIDFTPLYFQQSTWSQRLWGLVGLALLIALTVLSSAKRRAIRWRPVIWGVVLQFLLAFLVLKTPFGRGFFEIAKRAFVALIEFADQASLVVFGSLADPSQVGVVLFVKITATIVLVGSLTAVLYHIGVMQLVVYGLARVMQWTLGTSGAESLAAASNVFVGQTEAPLTVRPYLKGMTASELNSMMCGGMATVAGGVLAVYVGFGLDGGHLLAASVLSAPAALAIAKILLPESETPETAGRVPFSIDRVDSGVLDALCRGASEGFKLAMNVIAMLIAITAIMFLVNALLDGLYQYLVPSWFDFEGRPDSLSLQLIIGKIFQPLAYLIGVDWSESGQVGSLLGTRMIFNEFIAYQELALVKETLSPRAVTLSTYALCGFANFASIAIQIGGIGNLESQVRPQLARYGLLSMVGGTLATLMTATIAGVFL